MRYYWGMARTAQRGYIGLLGMVITVGLIGLFIYIAYVRPSSSGPASATSTPTRVGQSSIEQDLEARDSAKAIQDMSQKRADEINAQMNY